MTKPDFGQCKCEHAIQSLGVLYKINMGKGWVRTTTHPECPEHALCQGYTAEVRAGRRNGRWLNCCVHGTKDC